MKKKLVMIVVMIFVCTGLFVLAQKVQNSHFNDKVSAASQVKSKTTGLASNNEVQPSEKVESVSEQSKTNSATDTVEPSTVANKTVDKASEAPKVSPKPISKPVVVPATTPTPQPAAVKPEDIGPFNFRIFNTINGKVIMEKNIDFNGKTLDEVTCKLLNEAGIKYINEGEGGSTSYFYSIAGLTEKKSGGLSGWCFYVNEKKIGIGAGSYKCNKGDKVEWKYLTDALNN